MVTKGSRSCLGAYEGELNSLLDRRELEGGNLSKRQKEGNNALDMMEGSDSSA